MNKKYVIYDLIFLLSFITYFFVLIARPYITAKWWADIVLFLFILAVIYQIIYMLYLRKYNNISFKFAVSLYFLYLFSVLEIYIFYYYFNVFVNDFNIINGSFAKKLLGGLNSVQGDGWAHLVNLPILFLAVTYQIIFFVTKRKLNVKEK